ncbi:Mth938-like domain-containing protein [Fluviibacterium sp. S390]|uniref:Mth938-like domain-containing protein n=1 Tax=Fluviibacterium sp. S390 TaxID=3415139 RepID=UPI003C7AC62F
MRLNEIRFRDGMPVEGYGPGFFRVGGKVLTGGLLLLPDHDPAIWQGYDELDPLMAAACDLDVLFIGTGSEMTYLPTAFREALEGAGIGLEPMASPQACRSYNVLLSEGRRVGLAARPVT